ncbi:hypothetical protein J3R83DRAFT_8050 [Lanmaoa asiatica]|nr:hypothetical protein J3R83DRAFT_8050 [Lanmaoa asiatica]
MLTKDFYHGMFHYHIRVTTMPVPSMSVKVLAKRHAMWGTNISTWSLGSVGLRGVFVGMGMSINQRVVAFTTHPSRLRAREAPSVPGEDSAEAGIRQTRRTRCRFWMARSSILSRRIIIEVCVLIACVRLARTCLREIARIVDDRCHHDVCRV